jgi:quercetin dioxygenase-like cupin family protein
MRTEYLAAAVCALALSGPTVFAENADTAAKVAPQFMHALPNIPGKVMSVVTVSYAPGAASPGHRHGQAFVYAYVLEGKVRTQVEGEPEKVLGPGESWFEAPGAHHMVSGNASKTEPAKFLVVFIGGDKEELVTMDK